MTVFKTFWKVVKKYKGVILLYTILLIVFGLVNMTTSDNQINFEDTKPDILIINRDKEEGLTKNLVDYIKENSNIIEVKENEEAIDDALFYRDVNYIIYIPENYSKDILNKKEVEIDIKSTGDYMASLAEMMLSRYIKMQKIYVNNLQDETEIIKAINNNINKKTEVEITSKLDTHKTSNATFYFNFASYSIMAVVIFIICLVISSFNESAIKKRTIVSSTSYRRNNRNLLLASFIYAIIVWSLFNILGVIILGDTMFEARGFVYMLNSFVFTFCSLTIALLISTIVKSKNAVNGIVNVLALGSSFLCGAFVPVEVLPDNVLRIAHILPTYWYINSNQLLKTMETINLENLKPVLINIIVIVIYAIAFIILNNIISKRKQKNI